jgi:hypothetical protein
LEREWEREQELGLEQEQEREREFMIPLLLILLSGMAFGCEKVCKQKYVDEVPVDISCSSNCGQVVGFLDMGKSHWQPVEEQEPTYMVEASSATAPRYSVERLLARKDARVPCGDDYETCRDLADALNEAHRRRVK